MKLKNIAIVVLSAFLGASIAIFFSNYVNQRSNKLDYQTENLVTPIKAVSYPNYQIQPVDFRLASELATPAVVHVNTRTTNKQVSFPQGSQEDLLHYFFGQPKTYKPRESRGSGSGVIISSNGYIVTNNHVVENSDEIEVTLSNNKSFKASIVGTDKDTDLALLKIEEEGLPFLQFANSDSVNVGEWVLAVGNPFNLASTVTAGIVSAKGRNINLLENVQGSANTAIESFIQTDAAINPGNSGGALVNTRGDVIGINTAIATPTGTYAGYAFAVPSNIAIKVVSDLKEFGTVQRAFMGVNILSVDNNIAEELNLPAPKGVYIQNVMPGGSAAEAGLQNEDIIVEIEGVEINDVAGLQEKIALYRPGNVIEVSYLRKNVLKHATLSLKNKFNNQELLSNNSGENADLGISLKNLKSAELNALNIENGIEVADIRANGLVDKFTAMKKGFIITKIDNQKIKSVEDFAQILKEKKGEILIEGRYKKDNRSYLYSLNI